MSEIRDLRRAAGLKQREFAALLSVPLETLEIDAAETRFAQRHERPLLDAAAEVSGLGVAHDRCDARGVWTFGK